MERDGDNLSGPETTEVDSEPLRHVHPHFLWSPGWTSTSDDQEAPTSTQIVSDDTSTSTEASGTTTASSLADPQDIDLGNGTQTFDGSGSYGAVTGGKGPQTVTIDGDAQSVSLGAGSDALTIGFVGTVDMGPGADVVILSDGADVVEMGSGDDLLVFEASADVIAGDSADDPPTILDGGAGDDIFVTQSTLGDFDFGFSGDTVILYDRLTGASAQISGFETFAFADRELTAAELTALFSGPLPNIFASGGTQNVSVNDPAPGVSVVWNRATIEAVIETEVAVGPTVASRAYAMVHTAIYDAWAAFDDTAIRIAQDGKGQEKDNGDLAGLIADANLVESTAARSEAMSYAAYTVLANLFPDQLALFESVLVGRYGLALPAAATSLAAQVGIDAGEDLIRERLGDGSNQDGNYADTSGYEPFNPSPLEINDITRWTPENVPIDPEDGSPEQSFLTPHWGDVDGFALDRQGPLLQLEKALAEAAIRAKYEGLTDLDAAPEPFFTEAFAGSTLDIAARTITTAAPSSFGPPGTVIAVDKSLIGDVINPDFIAQAEIVLEYSASLGDPLGASDNVRAPSGDAGKISAEFYEDGPGTGFPPGTWMVFAEFVSARDALTLDEEALLFLAVGNAVFDAGIGTWEAKTAYDYARPVRVIRELGELGLIGEPGVDYKDEAGQVVRAYIPEIDATGLVLATEWDTYQPPGGNPSPPFAEYTSGHSAFSAAGAAVLRAFTGSDEFGGSVLFPQGSTLFEPGTTPQEDFTIEWATFTDAADAAGLSRLFGGIHFEEGDFHGRALGEFVGGNAYERALMYYDGMIVA